MKQKLLLCLAVAFGVLAFILTYRQIQKERDKALGGIENVVILVLNKDMTKGEKIKERDLTPKKIQRTRTKRGGYSQGEVLAKDLNRIIGRELLFTSSKGYSIRWADLKSEQGRLTGLPSVIPKKHRAISISVDATASVTNLIKPNDRVDIIGTFRFPEMKGDKSFDTLTLTILQNVHILATGREYRNYGLANTQGRSRGYSTITLALMPKEVEMIVFASQKGRLSLSLRGYEDTQIETNVQSVNFKYLEDNIDKYNKERAKREQNILYKR